MVMRIQRYSGARPFFSDLFTFEHEIGDLFNNFLGTGATTRPRMYPAIDLAEYENEWVLVAEMPGVKKGDVKISLENKFLTLSGVRRAVSLSEGSSLLRNEVEAGEFNRTIELPGAVEAEKVTAELENGILRVALPKPEEVRPREIQVH